MTHIKRSEKGMNILTYCGKYIDKRAAGATAGPRRRRRNRNGSAPPPQPAVIDARGDEVLTTFKGLCDKCLEAPGVIGILEQAMIASLKYMEIIHIVDTYPEGGVRMLCGMSWDKRSLFKNNIGFIPVEKLMKNWDNLRICQTCRDHPRAQLQLMADVEL